MKLFECVEAKSVWILHQWINTNFIEFPKDAETELDSSTDRQRKKAKTIECTEDWTRIRNSRKQKILCNPGSVYQICSVLFWTRPFSRAPSYSFWWTFCTIWIVFTGKIFRFRLDSKMYLNNIFNWIGAIKYFNIHTYHFKVHFSFSKFQ